MMTFDQMVMTATGCSKGEVDEVVELMRAESPNLGNLKPGRFTTLARRAYRALPEFRATMVAGV